MDIMAENGARSLSDDQVLTELVRRLREAFQPERIYLFGSRGAGARQARTAIMTYSSSCRTKPLPERKRSRLAYQALRGTHVAADVLVWTRQAFESRLRLPASLPATVALEGKLLYAR